MSDDPHKRWGCNECNSIGSVNTLLIAPNPFKLDETIMGCPNCKSIDSFWELCDEPGCNKAASSGWPSPQGYRRTCWLHSRH